MAANLKIASEFGNAEVKVDPIHGEPRKVNGKAIKVKSDGSPVLKYKDPTGTDELVYQEIDAATGQPIKGRTSVYVDPNGKEYAKDEVTAYYQTEDDELIPATKNVKTDVFEIKKWEPLENYLDKYQMESYYQVRPSAGDSTRDHTKRLNVELNTVELFKLWKHMTKEGVVGRGELNLSSSGYLKKYAYLRPIKVGTDGWSFEIAVFKENKPITWHEKLDWQPSMLNKGATVKVKGKEDATVVSEI